MGAQLVRKDPGLKEDGRRYFHDLHILTKHLLSGDALDELTNRFIETLCNDIDKRFPISRDDQHEWETIDLCELVKSLWTHASIEALIGTNVYSIWPDIDHWLWEFDATFPQIIAQYPRLLFPKPYKVREEGIKMLQQWEEEAWKAEAEGKIETHPDHLWDPYWGHAYSRQTRKYNAKNGMSARGRAGSTISIIWGVSNEARPP